MKPGYQYQFGEPFASQLQRALSGYAPWKTGESFKNKAMNSKPPSEKQIYWLQKKGLAVPATMKEASEMLDKAFAK